MSDEVNVTVSEETPISVAVAEVAPFLVTVTEDVQINVTPAPVEAFEFTVEDKEVIDVQVVECNGNLLRFTSEILATDGDETSFTLAHSFISGSLAIYKNGVLASDEYDEKADRSGVDFDIAPASDDICEARYAYV